MICQECKLINPRFTIYLIDKTIHPHLNFQKIEINNQQHTKIVHNLNKTINHCMVCHQISII